MRGRGGGGGRRKRGRRGEYRRFGEEEGNGRGQGEEMKREIQVSRHQVQTRVIKRCYIYCS